MSSIQHNLNQAKPLSSIQILMTLPNAGTTNDPMGNHLHLPLPIYGHYKVKMFGIWYAQSTTNPQQVIQFQSQQMKLKYPAISTSLSGSAQVAGAIQSMAYPTIISTQAHQIPSLSGDIDFEMIIAGELTIRLVDLLTGLPPLSFQQCLFTLSFEKVSGGMSENIF